MTKKALLVGSFDPFHLGHLDIAERASKLFDELHIVVASNTQKQTLLTLSERAQLIQKSVAHLPNIHVTFWEGLTAQYAQQHQIGYLVRGLRLSSDMEWEQTLEAFNKQIWPHLEIIYLMTRPQLRHISSRALRELIFLGHPVNAFVPEPVWQYLQNKCYRN